MRSLHPITVRCAVDYALIGSLLLLSGCAIGTTELILIFAITFLVFGATRLPQLGRALGPAGGGGDGAGSIDPAWSRYPIRRARTDSRGSR